MPVKCHHCSRIIPVEQRDATNGSTIQCTHCLNSFEHEKTNAYGDPRNQAIIIHEDGWNPHSTSSAHSIAAITVRFGCMSKANRSNVPDAMVYSFVPVHMRPHNAPHKYDAFFQPLIDELEELLIYGEEVYFAGEGSEDCEFPTLRAVPLFGTADSKAHCEIGLTNAGGYRGC